MSESSPVAMMEEVIRGLTRLREEATFSLEHSSDQTVSKRLVTAISDLDVKIEEAKTKRKTLADRAVILDRIREITHTLNALTTARHALPSENHESELAKIQESTKVLQDEAETLKEQMAALRRAR